MRWIFDIQKKKKNELRLRLRYVPTSWGVEWDCNGAELEERNGQRVPFLTRTPSRVHPDHVSVFARSFPPNETEEGLPESSRSGDGRLGREWAGLSASVGVGLVSDRFQTGVRPVSDQCLPLHAQSMSQCLLPHAQTMSSRHVRCTVMSDAHSCRMHSHVGCTVSFRMYSLDRIIQENYII